MVNTFYRCSKCSTEFGNKEIAEECENKYKPIDFFEVSIRYGTGYKAHQIFPEILILSDPNYELGSIVYQRIK